MKTEEFSKEKLYESLVGTFMAIQSYNCSPLV